MREVNWGSEEEVVEGWEVSERRRDSEVCRADWVDTSWDSSDARRVMI